MTDFLKKRFSVYPPGTREYRDNHDRIFGKKKLIIKWGVKKVPPDPDPKAVAELVIQDIIRQARASGKLVEEQIDRVELYATEAYIEAARPDRATLITGIKEDNE